MSSTASSSNRENEYRRELSRLIRIAGFSWQEFERCPQPNAKAITVIYEFAKDAFGNEFRPRIIKATSTSPQRPAFSFYHIENEKSPEPVSQVEYLGDRLVKMGCKTPLIDFSALVEFLT